MKKFDFSEVLSCLECGFVVGLTLNGVERRYYMNDAGEIICVPRNNPYLSYTVKDFKIDAILSREWVRYDED